MPPPLKIAEIEEDVRSSTRFVLLRALHSPNQLDENPHVPLSIKKKNAQNTAILQEIVVAAQTMQLNLRASPCHNGTGPWDLAVVVATNPPRYLRPPGRVDCLFGSTDTRVKGLPMPMRSSVLLIVFCSLLILDMLLEQ
jgi:hypothetical protein